MSQKNCHEKRDKKNCTKKTVTKNVTEKNGHAKFLNKEI